MIRYALGLAILVTGCKKDKDAGTDAGTVGEQPDSTDSGSPDTDDSGSEPCTAVVAETDPEGGDTGWYYRDEFTVEFTEDGSSADISLIDGAGTDIPLSVSWGEGNFVATIISVDALDGNASYTLKVEVCDTPTQVGFTTSEYGAALEGGAESLVDNTYFFDLPNADFVEPPGIGTLLKSYLDVPLLIGVTGVATDTMNLRGAQGQVDSEGGITQDTRMNTWDFIGAEFDAPFFTADTESINIRYGSTDIPIDDFHIEGTFSADGTSIGGGRAWGLGDTRNLGPLMGIGDEEDAVCAYAEAFGLECLPCNDGEPLCLFIEAWFDPAVLIDGVVIESIE